MCVYICRCTSIATAACNCSNEATQAQQLFSHKRLSASIAQLRAFSQCCPAQGFQPVLRSARLSARAEPWRRSQSVPGAFYQCTEDAGVFNEYVKHGVMAE